MNAGSRVPAERRGRRFPRPPGVELLSVADDGEWLRLRRALWPDRPADAHWREMGGLRADPWRGTVFVYRGSGGVLSGFVEVRVRPDPGTPGRRCAEVQGWYVDPKHRGRGIGSALLGAATMWARAHGCRETLPA